MTQLPLRILCLGDSLTSGYVDGGIAHHPYSEALEAKLKAAFPGVELVIEEDGEDGGLTQHFQGRATAIFAEYRRKKCYFDWTIVLGGTNDIAYAITPEAIFENLKRTWNLAALRYSKVLALTVPELGRTTSFQRLDARRDELNSLILNHTHRNYHSFDLKSSLSFKAMSEDDRQKYWDPDGVHLTEAGYDLMGDKIGAALADILHREADAREHAQDGAQGERARPVRRKRKFRDDEVDFDEENGSPEELQRGYIVVRWKDLD